MTAEVIPFPGNQNPQADAGGDIAKHFEGPEDIVKEEIQKSHGMMIRMFPSLFMTPGEVIQFLEETRGRVEEIGEQSA